MFNFFALHWFSFYLLQKVTSGDHERKILNMEKEIPFHFYFFVALGFTVISLSLFLSYQVPLFSAAAPRLNWLLYDLRSAAAEPSLSQKGLCRAETHCKSLPFFYFLTFEKGILLYIHPVGLSVGWLVGRRHH